MTVTLHVFAGDRLISASTHGSRHEAEAAAEHLRGVLVRDEYRVEVFDEGTLEMWHEAFCYYATTGGPTLLTAAQTLELRDLFSLLKTRSAA